MIPSSPLLAPLIPFLCPPLPPLPLLSYFGFTPHCSPTQYSAFVSSTMVVGADLNLYWSRRHVYLRLLSILVCLSKDVTGALVCSRGHSSSSFIIVRFIMLYMPGPYLFRSLQQLVAAFVVVCECQLRHNRSGSMLSLCTSV